jgi:hypothetical protein
MLNTSVAAYLSGSAVSTLDVDSLVVLMFAFVFAASAFALAFAFEFEFVAGWHASKVTNHNAASRKIDVP